MTDRVADLQLHSNASDGSDTPSEVVRRAHALGFAAIALTDHDTMAGVPEALDTASSLGMHLVPACELSTIREDDRQIDILAFGISHEDVTFDRLLRTLRDGRFGRAALMVERLNALGYPVAFETVVSLAGGPENIGRPHVARAMVEAGIVTTMAEAFTPEFLLEGGRCYVQRVKISPADAIARVHAAGGVAVVAHPGRTGLQAHDLRALVDAGADGIEVYYPKHDEAATADFLALAQHWRLLITGGSDDHGDLNEGRLMGSVRLPWPHLAALEDAVRTRRAGLRQ